MHGCAYFGYFRILRESYVVIAPSSRTLKNLEGVHPALIKVIMRAYQITPTDFGVVEPAVRTKAYQEELYAKGRTTPGVNPRPTKPLGDPVTWTLNSNHIAKADGYGYAVDVTAFTNGKPSWDEKLYPGIINACKIAAKELGIEIECGMDWKKQDLPHIQLKGA